VDADLMLKSGPNGTWAVGGEMPGDRIELLPPDSNLSNASMSSKFISSGIRPTWFAMSGLSNGAGWPDSDGSAMGDVKKLDGACSVVRGIRGGGWFVGPRREASACALSAAFLTGEHVPRGQKSTLPGSDMGA
jgi:hypothetical protein